MGLLQWLAPGAVRVNRLAGVQGTDPMASPAVPSYCNAGQMTDELMLGATPEYLLSNGGGPVAYFREIAFLGMLGASSGATAATCSGLETSLKTLLGRSRVGVVKLIFACLSLFLVTANTAQAQAPNQVCWQNAGRGGNDSDLGAVDKTACYESPERAAMAEAARISREWTVFAAVFEPPCSVASPGSTVQYYCPIGATITRGENQGLHVSLGFVDVRLSPLSPPPPEPAGSCLQVGYKTPNPIIPATGEKILDHEDYRGQGPAALSLIRSYRSSRVVGAITGPASAGLGEIWSHNHSTTLNQGGVAGMEGSTVTIHFGDGRLRTFIWDRVNNNYKPGNSVDILTINQYGGAVGFIYKNLEDDSSWQFDSAGKLRTVTQRNGWLTTYTYSTAATPISVAPVAGLLISVDSYFGRTLSFVYNASSQLVRVLSPEGQVITYSYDGMAAASRLTKVAYPGSVGDTGSKVYLYENTGFPQLVTGVIDENEKRIAFYAYDGRGRATSSQFRSGVGLYSVTYPASPSDATTVTDPLGTQRSYSYSVNQGKLAVTAANLPGASGAAGATSRVQDANGFITQETDFLGVSTMYTWDINRQLPLTTVKAAGLPEMQTTATQWHATFRLPVLVIEAGKSTAYNYDVQGNLLTRAVTDTATGVTRTNTWTYTAQGQLLSESAPGGVITRTFGYYLDTAFEESGSGLVGHRVGDLQSITNAAGHITQFNQYDQAGRVRQMTDAKGVVTDIIYTPRGWIASTTVTPPGGVARITSYTYDYVGQLTGVTLPDSTTLSYRYDIVQRLVGVTDAKGNSVSYSMDAMGNRVVEQITDSQGNLQRNITRVYDALNRIQQVTGAGN